jgi:hypothetical protein
LVGFLHKSAHNKFSTVELWLIVESFIYVAQVFAGIFFMILAYWVKFYSIWNHHKPDIYHVTEEKDDSGEKVKKVSTIKNIYYKRKGADFLHYMKFEAYNFLFHASFMFMDLIAIYEN